MDSFGQDFNAFDALGQIGVGEARLRRIGDEQNIKMRDLPIEALFAVDNKRHASVLRNRQVGGQLHKTNQNKK